VDGASPDDWQWIKRADRRKCHNFIKMNRRTPATLLYRYFQLKPTFIIGIRFDFCIFTTPLALHTRSILLDAAPILLAPNIRYCLTATPRTADGMYRADDSGQIKWMVSICFSNIFVQCLVQFTCPYFLSTKWKNQMVRNVRWTMSRSGLLRKSTSSPSRIFEALVLVPKVVANVLVIVHGIRGWWRNF